MPGQTKGLKHGQNPFYWILKATAGGPTSTTVVNWHLKVKVIGQNVSITKNCITVSMQKNPGQFNSTH